MNSYLRFYVLLLAYLGYTNADCRPGEYAFGDRCYRFITVPRTFDEAEAYCRTLGYHLVSIHSAFENNFLQQTAAKEFELTDSYFRIGLNTSDPTLATWLWTDGSYYDYWNWTPGEPIGSAMCTAFIIADGKWTTYPCSIAENFVCSGTLSGPGTTGTHTIRPASTSQPQRVSTTFPLLPTTTQYFQRSTTFIKNNCPRNWGFYHNTDQCYLFKQYNSSNLEWQLANSNGSIHSAGENDYVRDFAQGFFSNTNCFNSTTHNMKYVIGNITQRGGNYYWSDNSLLDYTPNSLGALVRNWYIVYAYVDYVTQFVSWYAVSSYDPYVANCYYYLCKQNQAF